MAGGRHQAPAARGLTHRIANATCTAVVVVGVGTLLLGGRASGYADMTAGGGGLVAGQAVVPGGLAPGAALTGYLPVSNTGAASERVTQVAFEVTITDVRQHRCDGSVVTVSVPALPVVRGHASQAIPFTVAMSRAAGDGCQGATFTTRYQVMSRPV